MNTAPLVNRTQLWVIVGAIIFLWSTAYPLMGYTVREGFPPILIPSARTLLPALGICLFIYLRGERLPSLRDSRWLWYGAMGVLGMSLPFFLQAKGQMHVDSGLSSILINGGMPLFTIVLAHFFIKSEPLSWRKGFGFLCGFIGIVVLFLPNDFSLFLNKNWQAQLFILSVALCYGLAAIIAKRAPETSSSVGAAIMLLCAAVVAVIPAIHAGIRSPEIFNFPTHIILALFALTILYTGLSDVLYLQAIRLSGPSVIAKINYVVPFFVIFVSILFFEESLTWRMVVALGLVSFGLWLTHEQQPTPFDEATLSS